MIKKHVLYLAWLFAIFGTLGSIYFGEMSGNEPCALCWYQRICLYPLVFILGVAAYKEEGQIWHYVIYQLLIGAFFALYQLIKDYFPLFSPLCGLEKPCEASYEIIRGVSFPLLSFILFIVILILVLLPNVEKR